MPRSPMRIPGVHPHQQHPMTSVTSCYPPRSSTGPGRASPLGTSQSDTRRHHKEPFSPASTEPQDVPGFPKAAWRQMPPYRFGAVLERLGADSQMLLTNSGAVSLPHPGSPSGWVLSTALTGQSLGGYVKRLSA